MKGGGQMLATEKARPGEKDCSGSLEFAHSKSNNLHTRSLNVAGVRTGPRAVADGIRVPAFMIGRQGSGVDMPFEAARFARRSASSLARTVAMQASSISAIARISTALNELRKKYLHPRRHSCSLHS